MRSFLSKFNNKKLLAILVTLFLITVLSVAVFIVIDLSDQKLPEFKGSETSIADKKLIDLGNDLSVTSIGNYTGLFFEDGSDDVVSDVMMIVLKNEAEKDLQLARVSVLYENYSAEFEATNIPAGKSVVLLEKNRRPFDNNKYISASAKNVVFFDEPMLNMSDAFVVYCEESCLEIKNISDKDISGTTYVYYKNVADDVLYGGITYRAVVEETIPAGESVSVLTQHCTVNNTEVMQVLNVGRNQ